jgi:hypothetical protein
MKETHSTNTPVSAVALEDTEATDHLSVGLSVIQDDKGDPVAALDQLFAKKDLLTLGSADMRQVLPIGEGRVGFRCDKTD